MKIERKQSHSLKGDYGAMWMTGGKVVLSPERKSQKKATAPVKRAKKRKTQKESRKKNR